LKLKSLQGAKNGTKASIRLPARVARSVFNEYQHGDIDRRTFLDRLGMFATGGLTAMAIFESLKAELCVGTASAAG
jgi:hypothetical protein